MPALRIRRSPHSSCREGVGLGKFVRLVIGALLGGGAPLRPCQRRVNKSHGRALASGLLPETIGESAGVLPVPADSCLCFTDRFHRGGAGNTGNTGNSA